MSKESLAPEPPAERIEQRRGTERRKSTLRALIYGSFKPRRVGPRRAGKPRFTDVDLHHPQWLGVALLIMLLSCADALLTLTLLSYGAVEINPIMAKVVYGDGRSFAATKIGLTAGGVILLTLLARVRAFGRVPVGAVLYAILAGYVILIGYELWLLDKIASLPEELRR